MNKNIKISKGGAEDINITPLIFTKKVNDKSKVIPLINTVNTLGQARHFPPATKEWSNSIYAYNNNSVKNLPIAGKSLSKLINSYFNLYLSKNILKTKKIATRFRRLSLNKIFVSKAELKHTSDKVVITLFVYNEERRILNLKIKRLEAILFPGTSSTLGDNRMKKTPLSLKEKLSLFEGSREQIISYIDSLKESRAALVEKRALLKSNLLLNKMDSNIDYYTTEIVRCLDDPAYLKINDKAYIERRIRKLIDKEAMTVAYYKLLLSINKSKFEDSFILKLKPLIQSIYNKEVELNIVNLKTLCFNSDIFTQAIATKLKNRNLKLLRVLKSSLHMLKLPNVNRIREKYGKTNDNRLWLNQVKNLRILADSTSQNKDALNQLLLNIFPLTSSLTTDVEGNDKLAKKGAMVDNQLLDTKTSNSVESFVINSLKFKTMAGARLEARGRLTRRFTASRSVFKIKWKGSLKNIDSSYKGLSSVILRGHVKSNVQYSIVNSKTRNGAFGLKGWISSK